MEGDDCQTQYSQNDTERREVLRELKHFIPRFYGQCRLSFNGSEVSGFNIFLWLLVCFSFKWHEHYVNGFWPGGFTFFFCVFVQTEWLTDRPIDRLKPDPQKCMTANMLRISIGIFRRFDSSWKRSFIDRAPLLWRKSKSMEISSTSILDYSFLLVSRLIYGSSL